MSTAGAGDVRELPGLPPHEHLAACSRCGAQHRRLVQLRVVGHRVALCRACLLDLAALLEPGTTP